MTLMSLAEKRKMVGAESSDTPWVSLFSVAYDPYSGHISVGAYFKKPMSLSILPVL